MVISWSAFLYMRINEFLPQESWTKKVPLALLVAQFLFLSSTSIKDTRLKESKTHNEMLVWSGFFAILPHETRSSKILEQASAKREGQPSNLQRYGCSATTCAHWVFVTTRVAAPITHAQKAHCCETHHPHCKWSMLDGTSVCHFNLVLALRKLLQVYQTSPLGD